MADNYRTPIELFNALDKAAGGFAVDAAADESNHLTGKWYGNQSPVGEFDALGVENWLSPAFCNPPYGRGIGKWLDKFREQSERGNVVVGLIPASVGAKWWYEKVVPFADILFLVGRVPFLESCKHCNGTGHCSDRLTDCEGKPGGTCCDGLGDSCDVCSGLGAYTPDTPPKYDCAIVLYSQEAEGQVTWLDWRKHEEV